MNKFVKKLLEQIIHDEIVELDKIYEVKFKQTLEKEKQEIINNLETWFIDRIRDGEFPKDSSEWWSCIWCGHVDKKDCRYCSNCGARW